MGKLDRLVGLLLVCKCGKCGKGGKGSDCISSWVFLFLFRRGHLVWGEEGGAGDGKRGEEMMMYRFHIGGYTRGGIM